MQTIVKLTGNESDADCKEIAWKMFCQAHPHEAHDHDPEGFWRVFHGLLPQVSREEMLGALKATEEPNERD